VLRAVRPFVFAVAALLLLLDLQPISAQGDEAGVGILVVKEHGVGSSSLAQPYLDRFVAIAAEENGWTNAKGQYFNNRSAAEKFIQTNHPHYGIFSLPTFLALRAKYKLRVIGQVVVSLAGGRQYYVVSKDAAGLAGCKGKNLASDHTDDARFIERVVAGKSLRLTDFRVVQTQRPLQTIKKAMNGQAACALIDDAQFAELAHLDGANGLHPVWQSAELPPMVVAAFPVAPESERKRLQEHLGTLCDNEGESACAEVGISSLKAADATDYAAVIAAYGE
jgi:hypothetical protein